MKTVRGIGGSYPDLSGLGRQFKPAAQLIKQLEAIREEDRNAQRRMGELEAEVQYQQHQHKENRATALRNGEQPAANPTAEHVAEDVAFLMANRLHMNALEVLAHRGKDGELEHNRWQRMLGLREYEMDALTDDLHARKLAYDDDTGDRWERWTWTLTDRGRAALTAVEPEIAKEDRLRRHLGPLTYADLWAHDALHVCGPLSWMAWAAEARPHLHHAQQQAWLKSGKAIGADGNYQCPPYDTAFAKAAFKLLKRGFVERRQDGTYAAIRPPILKPENS